MHKLMLVDDERNVLRALERVLAAEDRDIESFDDPEAALRRARTTPFDLVISDYRMPGMDGVRLLREIKDAQPETMRMILSAHADLEVLLGAINEAEIFRFLGKPWQDYELRATVAQALSYHDVLVENRRLADQVRAQAFRLRRQEAELARLEREHPGITRVRWGPDGSILVGEEDLARGTADELLRR